MTELKKTLSALQSHALPLVIVNPASAGGATGRAWAGIASEIATHFGAFETAFTRYAGHARELARDAAKATSGRFIIACGGDGTANEVANGILMSGADAELGVLPNGTGGDFRRTLELSTHAPTVARSWRTGVTHRIDVGRVTFQNFAGHTETRFFLGVASFGMSAEVIQRAKDNSSQWLPQRKGGKLGGTASYALAALQATLAAERQTVNIQLDGADEGRLTVANLCICNARYFGGGMKIAPNAKLDDGLLDIVVVGDLSTTEILTNAYKLYRGTHLSLERVGHAHAQTLTAQPVNRESRIALEIDGELPGYLPAKFEIVPQALRVRVPRKRNDE